MVEIKAGRFAGLIKSDGEIALMREAGRMLAEVREMVAAMAAPGVSTGELDDAAREGIESRGARPAFLGYHGYPATICASINEEVVHGIPSRQRKLQEGDILSVDLGLVHKGFVSDTAVTVGVGLIDPELERLLDVTRRALAAGIAACLPGARLGDVSSAIQTLVEKDSLAVVREYTGHGIGREMHEDPKIPNYGTAGKGMRLKAGMTFALEPMVNLGVWRTKTLEDGWTVVTADAKPSAHFEHTVAIREDGPEILTQRG